MFPLTHIYCANRIVNSPDKLILYGSIFPDIPITGLIEWEAIKEKTVAFSNFIILTQKNLTMFAIGLLLHEESLGIDRFVHGKNGYAIKKGQKIKPYVKKYFLNENILDTAHTFIELAVEIKILSKNPNLVKDAKDSIQYCDKYIENISSLFASFFNKETAKTLSLIQAYNQNIIGINMQSDFASLINRLKNSNVEENHINKIIEKSLLIIDKDYEKFLSGAIKRCKEDLAVFELDKSK